MFVIACGAVAVWSVSALRVLFLTMLGRNWCPLPAAMAAPGNVNVKERLKRELGATAIILERDGNNVLWQIDGARYWLPAGSKILPGMVAEQKLGSYEKAGHGVRAGEVVLDCGASIGLYTLHALALGAAHVIAVEPSPRNIECLERNLSQPVSEGRVTIVAKGVWDQETTRGLQMQPGNSAADSVALSYRGSIRGPDVALTTIDRIVDELDITRLDYIKMDVEGAERAALHGAISTIRRFRPRMTIAMEHRFTDPAEIPRLVTAIDHTYQVAPGPCIELGSSIRPAILDFY